MKRKAKRIVANSSKSHISNVKFPAQNDDGFGTSVPPSMGTVEIYFDQKGLLEVASDFYEEHELRKWTGFTGHPVINWKVCAAEWIYNYRQEMKKRLRQSPFNCDHFN
jgi:hypothetical protein